LAHSSPDKCPGFDQRDCSFLDSGAQAELCRLVGSSGGLWTGSELANNSRMNFRVREFVQVVSDARHITTIPNFSNLRTAFVVVHNLPTPIA
jgi:hypothetical protein